MTSIDQSGRTLATALLAFVLILPCHGAFAALQVVAAAPLKGEALVDALHAGGYVLFLRHAATQHKQVDKDRNDLGRCETQRNLSPAGRAQAVAIGAAFRQLALPVGEVWSSPYCRCRDTAQLAFGRFEIDPSLYFAIGIGADETARLTGHLQTMLSTPPAPGTNNLLVSHTANLKEAAGIWPKPEGVMAVFRPLGEGRVAYHGMVEPGDWPHLSSAP